MTTVEDLRKKDSDSYREGRMVDEHPSYGMISISRVEQGGKGARLFGSGIKHGHYISLVVKKAVRYRDEYSDHYYGEKTLLTVNLSASQLAGLMTQANTEGVPCTLNYMESIGYIEPPPEHNIKEELTKDLKIKFKNLSDQIVNLENSINERLTGTPNKQEKESIKFDVLKICQAVKSNLSYLQECQIKKLEEIQNQMVTEAENTINSMIHNAGLSAIAEQIKNKEIEQKTTIKLIRR